MFAYIYANGGPQSRGSVYFTAAKTQETINQQALSHIRDMAQDRPMPPNPEQRSPELTAVFDAIKKRDVAEAIDAWNNYEKIINKHHVACHKIESIKFVE